MKSATKCFATLSLLVAAAAAAASDSVSLNVSAKLEATSCSIKLGSTTVQLAERTWQSLAPKKFTALDSAAIDLTVGCAAPTLFRLDAWSVEQATVPKGGGAALVRGMADNQAFGLGTGEKGAIGAYVLALSNVVADGAAADLITRPESGGTSWASTDRLAPAMSVAVGGSDGLPRAVKDFSASLDVAGVLACWRCARH